MKIELLKNYKSNKSGSIIEVTLEQARTLISKGIAKQLNSEFLLNSTNSIMNFVSRAFNKSPKIK